MPLPLRFETSRCTSHTRRAAGMDARRFPTEPGWRVGKCRNERLAGFASSGRRFSLVPFLLGSTKRNELGRASGRKRLTLLLRLFAYGDIQDQTLPLALRRAGSFLLLAQKKRNQRKRPSPTHPQPAAARATGFSNSASCLGRKTPHIHVRRPSGWHCMRHVRFHGAAAQQSNINSNSTLDILMPYANLSPDIA
ncbi:hypothetical protein LUTEI9C_30293 [Luteimonas sp. 9C]|nr:hypothetical protein LUTEI9C_30293 [Luteimonas sp. 9C]